MGLREKQLQVLGRKLPRRPVVLLDVGRLGAFVCRGIIGRLIGAALYEAEIMAPCIVSTASDTVLTAFL